MRWDGHRDLLREDVSHDFAVRPATMLFGCCGQFFIGGPDGTSQAVAESRLGHIRWAKWEFSGAHGYGTAFINDCKPDCASGTFLTRPIEIWASEVRHHRFTRLGLRYRWGGRRRHVVDHLEQLSSTRGVAYAWF